MFWGAILGIRISGVANEEYNGLIYSFMWLAM
jgi:hypothetical protein